MESLLGIISYYDPDISEKKDLLAAARTVLDLKIPSLKDSDIKEICDNYEALFRISVESPRFFTRVLTLVLSDFKITEIEKEFIMKSIQHGMAISFSKYGKVIFDGSTYSFDDDESRSRVRDIIRVALDQHDDILVKQYNDHEPLFPNSGTGMTVAANDITGKGVLDAVYRADHSLDSSHWLVSLFHISDQRRSMPSQVFLLMERRDEFGYYEAYKISDSTDCNRDYHYPTELNLDFRKQLFVDVDYNIVKRYKPRYYVTTIKVDASKGMEIIDTIKQDIQFIDDEALYYIMAELDETNISRNWREYLYGNTGYKKIGVLGVCL